MSIIEAYVTDLTKDRQSEVLRIRRLVLGLVPDAEEKYSYNLPALTYKGRALIAVAATKEFLSLYPFGSEVIEVMKDKLTDYTLTKGAIHLRKDQPISAELIKQIVTYRIKQLDKS